MTRKYVRDWPHSEYTPLTWLVGFAIMVGIPVALVLLFA